MSQYIDDHCVMTAPGGTALECDRLTYAFMVLKCVHGGYWLGPDKCNFVPNVKWTVLGLEVDTLMQCFRVPVSKKEDIYNLCVVLCGHLQRGEVNLMTLARFAGKIVFVSMAVPFLKNFQNVQYSMLSDVTVDRNDDAGRQPLWWKWMDRGRVGTQRQVDRRTCKWLLYEVMVCTELVLSKRVWGFLDMRHRSVVTHYSDATLRQAGVHILMDSSRAPDLDVKSSLDIVFGGTLPLWMQMPDAALVVPDLVDLSALISANGTHMFLGHRNIALTEFAALVYGFMVIDVTPNMLVLYQDKRVTFFIDNKEVMFACKKGRVRGELRYKKLPLLCLVKHYEMKWNMLAQYEYVPTDDNPADLPSRHRNWTEVRLSTCVKDRLWKEVGGYTLDWMAAFSNAMCEPGTQKYIRYYSKTIDAYSAGVNVLAHDVDVDPCGRRENGFCNPPWVMLNAVTAWGKRCKARVTLIHPKVVEPKPLWAARLGGALSKKLPKNCVEKRVEEGWIPIEEVELYYTHVDWKEPFQ